MFQSTIFRGELPRLNDRTLPDGTAALALNCNLENGEIAAWPSPQMVKSYPDQTEGLIEIDGEFFPFKNDIQYVEYPLFGKDIYIILEQGELFITSKEMMRVGMKEYVCPPKPNDALWVIRGDYDDTTEQRDCAAAYFITYINRFGMETGPSNIVHGFSDGAGAWTQNVHFTRPPDWCTGIRVWRSEVAYRTGDEQEAISEAEFFLIAELDASTWNMPYGDDGSVLDSSLVFQPELYIPHPINLEHLDILYNGALVASSGCQIHIGAAPSLAPMPFSWPHTYDITLDDQIVGLVSAEQITYVITEGRQAMLQQTSGDALSYDIRVDINQIPCVAPESVAFAGDRVLFLSNQGIAQVTPPNRADAFKTVVLSRGVWTPKQWKELYPQDAKAFVVDGKYIFMTPVTGYVFYFGSTIEPGINELETLTKFNIIPFCDKVLANADDLVYYLKDNILYKWDISSTDDLVPYSYRSKIFSEAGCTSYTAGKIISYGEGDSEFTLVTHTSDAFRVRKQKPVTINKAFRMPSNYRATEFQFWFDGTKSIVSLHMGGSIRELGAS